MFVIAWRTSCSAQTGCCVLGVACLSAFVCWNFAVCIRFLCSILCLIRRSVAACSAVAFWYFMGCADDADRWLVNFATFASLSNPADSQYAVGLWRICFGPLFGNACSGLRLCQNIVCVVYPARYVPSFLYPHWTYRTRSASTWRVSSHSLGAKISWNVVTNVCPGSFSMPECRKASACWMLPTKPASTLDSKLHAQLSSLGRIGTDSVFDPSLLPHTSPGVPKVTDWSATDTPPLMLTIGGACARLLRQLLSTLHLHPTNGFRNVVAFPPPGFNHQNVSDMVQCSSHSAIAPAIYIVSVRGAFWILPF